MKLELEEIKITDNRNIFDTTLYEKEGMYMVNDGYTGNIVIFATGIVSAMPIPQEITLQNYISVEDKNKAIIDERANFINELNYLKKDIIETISNLKQDEKSSTQSMDIEAITKMIAVSQKPELLYNKN